MRESPSNIAIMLEITIPHLEVVGKMLLEDTTQEERGFLHQYFYKFLFHAFASFSPLK